MGQVGGGEDTEGWNLAQEGRAKKDIFDDWAYGIAGVRIHGVLILLSRRHVTGFQPKYLLLYYSNIRGPLLPLFAHSASQLICVWER